LKKATDAVDIFSLGPFQLTSHIKSDFLGKTADGTYRLDWIGTDKWREELNLGGYTEIRIGLGGQVYRSRNINFIPPPVMELRRLLAFSDPARLLPGEEAGNLYREERERRLQSAALRSLSQSDECEPSVWTPLLAQW